MKLIINEDRQLQFICVYVCNVCILLTYEHAQLQDTNRYTKRITLVYKNENESYSTTRLVFVQTYRV